MRTGRWTRLRLPLAWWRKAFAATAFLVSCSVTLSMLHGGCCTSGHHICAPLKPGEAGRTAERRGKEGGKASCSRKEWLLPGFRPLVTMVPQAA